MSEAPPEPRWIDDDPALRELVATLRDEPRYALDTEFHGERTYFPKLALVQVAWPGGIALVDPLAVDPEPLAEILGGPGTMVAHAADQDLVILERACGRGPSDLFDTQVAAGFAGMGTPSLAALAQRVLDVSVAKGDRLTDWTRRPLNRDQRRYAAGDVDHLLALADELARRLAASGRLAWATDECRARLARDRSLPDPRTAWWKMKGSRSLRGRSRGVAQEVAAWRERTARARDLPPRFVLPDLAMAGIVARPPRDATQLAAVRGLDGRHVKSPMAEELLDAIETGLALDAAALHLPPTTPVDRGLQPAVALVAAWMTERASELGIEPALLGTRADIQELVQAGTGRLATGWRAALVGESIRALVAGEASLVLAQGGRRMVLEPRAAGAA